MKILQAELNTNTTSVLSDTTQFEHLVLFMTPTD